MAPIDQLISNLEGLVKELCETLRNVQIPTRLWTRIVREDESRTSFPQELRPDFSSITPSLYDLIKKSSFLGMILDVAKSDAVLASKLLVDAGGNPIQDIDSQSSWLERYVVLILTAYFKRANSFIFHKTLFNDVSRQITSELGHDQLVVKIICPLINVNLSMPTLNLSPTICLRQLTIEELENWINPAHFLFGRSVPIHELHGLRSAIEVKISESFSSFMGSSMHKARASIEQLVNAVSLLANTDVFVAWTEETSDSILWPRGAYSDAQRLHFAGPLHIDDEFGQRLIELWPRFINSTSIDRIKVALSRWDSSTHKKNQHDKQIDYWIALESLFIPGTNDELKYRVCFRIASFIGKTGSERVGIYQDMKKSYDIRSKYVHQATIGTNDVEIIQRTRKNLRESVLKIILNPDAFRPDEIEEVFFKI